MDYYSKNTHGYMGRSKEFLEYIENCIYPIFPEEVEEVVELGAGMGRFSEVFIKHFKEVHLVEPCKDYAQELSKCIDEYSNAKVYNVLAREFLINHDSSGRKEMIACFHLMHHLSLEQRNNIYQYVADNNAYGFLCEPNAYNPLFPVQIAMSRDMSFREEWQYLVLTKSRYSKELKRYDLEILESKMICYLPPLILKKAISIFGLKRVFLLEKFFSFFTFFPSYLVILYGRK